MPPFFIIGVPRSGTTLLSVLLSNHSKVYVDGESVGISLARSMQTYKRLFAYKPGKGKAAIFEQLMKSSHKQRLEHLIDWENQSSYEDLRNLFAQSVQKRAASAGKEVWGDKTPELIFYLTDILEIFPDARFLHVVRDPRSNALSLSNRQYVDFRLAVQYWKDINGRGLVYRQLLGGSQYQLVSYEALLKEPERVLTDICDFLEVPFEPGMLKLEEHASTDSKQAYVQKQIDHSKADRWKKELGKEQIFTVERIAGDLMEQLGYPLQELSDPLKARSLSYGLQFWLRQKDMFRLLFRARRVQMIDRELKPVKLSIGRRLKNFFGGTLKHTFSEDFLRIFKPADRR